MNVKFIPLVKPGLERIKELDLNDGFYYGQIRGFKNVVFRKFGRKAQVFLGGTERVGYDVMDVDLVGRDAPDTVQAFPVVIEEISVREVAR
jgi:hypothetical protein